MNYCVFAEKCCTTNRILSFLHRSIVTSYKNDAKLIEFSCFSSTVDFLIETKTKKPNTNDTLVGQTLNSVLK